MIKIITFLYKICTKISIRFGNAALELNSIRYHLEFGERDDDIYIVTYPKSGTTLMQMMVYQLTTPGNMDFNHIYDVSPWTDNDVFKNLPPRELPSPRIIKSHRLQSKFDKSTKGKFIVVVRDGMDVAVSQYHQNKNYNNPDLKFEEFINNFFTDKKNWFEFSQGWFKNTKKFPILYIRYEDILNDFESSLNKVAQFINVNIDPEDLPRIKERCSFQYMKSFEDKFGDEEPKKEKEKVFDQFIRKGKSGEGQEYFTEEHKKRFNELLKSYDL